MNSLKQENKKSNYFYLPILFIFYLFFLFINKQNLFQKFDQGVVSRYLRSQDIEDRQDLIKDRVFISDSDIYIASGYLYANGAKPTDYNFQHPPFIKYLFGLSAKYFGLPLLPNVIFGFIILLEVLFLGKLVFKSHLVGILSSILLMFDPVFKEVTTYALLDLGQVVFLLGFLILSFCKQQRTTLLWQGILLGLAMASKFYSPVLLFYLLVILYKLAVKQLNINHELKVVAVAILIFSLTYLVEFPFNIFYEQAKIIKFMLDHNQAISWGGVLKMFFGGYFLWPVVFITNLYLLFKSKFKSLQFLFCILPATYFLLLTFQVPFTRYFILILPFLYLSLSFILCKKYLK